MASADEREDRFPLEVQDASDQSRSASLLDVTTAPQPFDADLPEEDEAEREEDEDGWVLVPHDDDGMLPFDELANGVLRPATVAVTVMGLIRRLMDGQRQPSPRFEAYCQEPFFRLRSIAPWDVDSLSCPLQSLTSSSRSGSWLFRTEDQRLILKKIPVYEKDKLVAMAASYVDHMVRFPESALCPIYGCYRYTQGTYQLYFVLMGSCYPPGLVVRTLYDFKGSTADRTALELRLEAERLSPREGLLIALKDNDLPAPLRLMTEESWKWLRTILVCDSEFLRDQDIFDYSLLVAVADVQAAPSSPRTLEHNFLGSIFRAMSNHFHGAGYAERPKPAYRSWPCARKQVLYLGIIDYLTPWSVLNIGHRITIPKGRDLEYFFMKYAKPGCSIMPPVQYQERFVHQVICKFSYPGQRQARSSSFRHAQQERSPPPPPVATPPRPPQPEPRSLGSEALPKPWSTPPSMKTSTLSDNASFGLCWDCHRVQATLLCAGCDSPSCGPCHATHHTACSHGTSSVRHS
eukprot:EG_transcript_9539